MKRFLSLLAVFAVTYAGTVGAIWGMIEAATFFSEDQVKGLNDTLWWIPFYIVPLILAFSVTKNRYQSQRLEKRKWDKALDIIHAQLHELASSVLQEIIHPDQESATSCNYIYGDELARSWNENETLNDFLISVTVREQREEGITVEVSDLVKQQMKLNNLIQSSSSLLSYKLHTMVLQLQTDLNKAIDRLCEDKNRKGLLHYDLEVSKAASSALELRNFLKGYADEAITAVDWIRKVLDIPNHHA